MQFKEFDLYQCAVSKRSNGDVFFNSHRQHLNDYLGALLFYNQELDCIGALSFYDSKRSIGGAYFSIAASASQPAINSAPISHDSKRSIGGAFFLIDIVLKTGCKSQFST